MPDAPERPESLRLHLLGRCAVIAECGRLPVPPVALRLVAFVALHSGHVDREQLAGTLWADLPDARARANLRITLWRLAQQAPDLVAATGSTVAIGSSVEVDLAKARARAWDVVRGCDRGDGELDEMLLAGALLPGWCEEWAIAARARWHQLVVHTLECRCRVLQDAGDTAAALTLARRLVELAPERDSAARCLARARAALDACNSPHIVV